MKYLLLIFFTCSLYSQGLKWKPESLEVLVDENQEFYYGKFFFVNSSDNKIKLKNIKTGCGCTTVKFEVKSYAPTQEGYIDFKVDLKNKTQVKKYLSIDTSESEGYDYRLNFKITKKLDEVKFNDKKHQELKRQQSCPYLLTPICVTRIGVFCHHR